MADKNSQKTLTPQYVKLFSCTGSQCEDTCCVGWRVDIDRNSYKKYNKLRDPSLKPLMDQYIKRNRTEASEQNYAYIQMDSNGACPMLTEEKLCGVQQKLDEHFLSDTCFTYPRMTNQVDGVIETCLSLSCPETARLVLLNPNPMEFDEGFESEHARHIIQSRIYTMDRQLMSGMLAYFWDIRVITIEILQNRDYALSDRLIALGLFYHKLEELLENQASHEIPDLIATYRNLVLGSELKDQLSSVPTDLAIQMKLLKELADLRFSEGISMNRYFECFAQFMNGIQYTMDSSVQEITARYQSAYNQFYLPYMKEHEHVLENYLINYVFKNVFPVSNDKTVFDQFVMLIVHYSLIKLHLIGMAGYHKVLTDELLVKLVQSFSKAVEHDPTYLQKIYDLLKQNGFLTIAYMAILIKN